MSKPDLKSADALLKKANECIDIAKDQHHLAERLHEVASQQLNNAEKQQDIAQRQHQSADMLEDKASKLDDVGNALEAKAVAMAGETPWRDLLPTNHKPEEV
jgi:hypothetical protein